MKIAVLGTGDVGSVLGRRWALGGHHVCFGSRDPESDRVRRLAEESGPTASAASVAETSKFGDVIVLATPWEHAQPVILSLSNLETKIVVDCTNPVSADFQGLDVGHTTSAAERIANWASGARVVKAFNSVSAAAMADPTFGDQRAMMFYCGDDPDAKAVVRQLAAELGFEPVDAGSLQIARFLEPFAMLFIQLAAKEGWGGDCAFKIMTR